MPKVKMDDEMKTFAANVLESIAQAKRGDYARAHTPANIAAYKSRGRPLGSVKDDAKQIKPTQLQRLLRLDHAAQGRQRAA